MQKKIKKSFSLLMAVAFVMQGWMLEIGQVFAASPGDVVINEVAWAGSSDSANDEWIELYNNSNQMVNLAGWVIEDDGVPGYKLSGNIAAHGYFLLERNENAVSNITADQLITAISLANSGDSLVLKDPGGAIIDKVNGGGGAWYAGDGTGKATMERIDPAAKDDVVSNWATAKVGNGSKSSVGSAIIGTPHGANSNYAGASGGPEVRFDSAKIDVNGGAQTVNVSVYVDNALDLYAYGFEIDYPTNLLSFQSAQEAAFLKADGTATAFNAALKNNSEGSLVVGNARLLNPPKGLDGSGKLFNLTFKIVGTDGLSGDLGFGGSSFIANSEGDQAAKFSPAVIKINSAETVGPVTNLKIAEGEKRYSLKLSWDADSGGTTSYIVKRKMIGGNFVTLGTVTGVDFVDEDAVNGGGKLVPGITYQYEIIAMKNNVQSAVTSISGKETRGLVGDNDRSDSVNGRDIENLARSFGSDSADEQYNPLVDTNFDGIIDGKDLMDIGANFGTTY
ncbi:lamin tail domain-containing protein [Candidatus Peregrinibacteria bacterium]|nr:lamin tail domain-containing protein [Candidatus Peregrinibacteria bacterium]